MRSLVIATMSPAWLVAGLLVVGMPLALWLTWRFHLWLRRRFIAYARRHCEKNGIEVVESDCSPEFDERGAKTEFSIVVIKGRDAGGQTRFVCMQVWIFGVRKVLADEPWPESLRDEGLGALGR